MSHSDTPTEGDLVSAEWLAARLHDPRVVVLDCTTSVVADADGHERIQPERPAFLAGHIPGARFAEVQQDLSDPQAPYPFTLPTAAQLQAGLRRLGVNQDSTVVLYSTGQPWWATRVWWVLNTHGVAQVRVLDGGLKHWKALGLAVETGSSPAHKAGDIVVGSGADVAATTVTADALNARLGDQTLRLVNALPPDKFAGTTAVHGGRPGHIPGSLNLPGASLLDATTGLLKPAADRRELLAAQGLLDEDKDVVAYCGGGVSATLVLFALALAGRHDARLYDASLGEWGHRDDLPMARLS